MKVINEDVLKEHLEKNKNELKNLFNMIIFEDKNNRKNIIRLLNSITKIEGKIELLNELLTLKSS